ncbi:hypothetical protein ACS0TY_010012 [Phlomoides rotata]
MLQGKAVNSFSLSGKSFPLVYGEGASRECNPVDSRDCLAGCLDKSLVQGKIDLCKVYNGITEASTVGAVRSVAGLQSGPESSLSDVSFVVPIAGSEIQNKYTDSETIKNLNAPKVASFSSRGPNVIIPDILKVLTWL